MAMLSCCVALVLAGLGGLHVFWALGGGSAMTAVVPERAGKPLFRPGRAATLAVAGLLFVAAGVVLERGGIAHGLPEPLARWGTGLVAVAFLARAVGEFRYVGFFKSVRGTRFAVLDTRVYSPLCLALGLATALLAYGGG